ncbi:MAG: Wzz/FepE/Etk N-terminal domain-containing protein [Pseudomonadota bacterium]
MDDQDTSRSDSTALSRDVSGTEVGRARPAPVDPNEERIRKWREERLRVAEEAKKARLAEKKRVAEDAAMQRVPTIDQVDETRRSILRQRRRRRMWLGGRLLLFVALPTLLAGLYYLFMSTPLYKSEAAFIVQSSKAEATGNTSGLFGQGPLLDTIKDTMAVRHFIQSATLMKRMEAEKGFLSHFDSEDVDMFTRRGSDMVPWRDDLEFYNRRVEIGLDPVEGILKLNVFARTPEDAQRYAQDVISYSEAMVNTLSETVRESQLELALRERDTAADQLKTARQALVDYQGDSSTFDPVERARSINQVITGLETERANLAAQLSAARAIGQRNRIVQFEAGVIAIDEQIAAQRQKLVDATGGLDLSKVASQTAALQSDVEIAQQIFETALENYNRARIEASEQLRFLSTVVDPTLAFAQAAPEPIFDTIVIFLVAMGLYSILSIFLGALREHSRL